MAASPRLDGLGYLGRIVEARARDFSTARKDFPLPQLRREALKKPAPRGFRAALEAHIESHGIAIVAEIKKASPSRGLICPDFDPAATAAAYERGGAAALSVLTEERFFLGAADHLRQARGSCGLPALRKDFVLDEWSLCQSRFLEADCALLIAALFDAAQLRSLVRLAADLGFDALVEIHDEADLERALAADADLIGINNRDLKSFEVSLAATERLAPQLPPKVRVISESGLARAADIERLTAAGVRAFLIGESLARAGTGAVELLLSLRSAAVPPPS